MADDELTPQPLETEGTDDYAAPADGLAEPVDEPLAEPGPGAGRLVVALLVAAVVVALSVLVWVLITLNRKNQYVGVSVVMGLLVGYVIRVVSKRHSLPIRILASVITAIGAAIGTVLGEAAYASATSGFGFKRSYDAFVKPKWTDVLTGQKWLTYVVYAAAVVIAFLAAGPQKPAKSKQPAADVAEPEPAERVEEEPPLVDPAATDEPE